MWHPLRRRRPGRTTTGRRRGRALLFFSAALDVLLLAGYLAVGAFSFNEWHLASLVLTTYAVIYLARSRRVKDVFADFPIDEVKEAEARQGLYYKRHANRSIRDEIRARPSDVSDG